MLQQTLMFLASDSPPVRGKSRAVSKSPPAKKLPVQSGNIRQPDTAGRTALALNIVANAVGFVLMMASLWFSLWLMQALVPVTAL